MAKEKQSSMVLVGRALFTVALVASVAFVFYNSLQVGVISSAASARVLAVLQKGLVSLGAPALADMLTEHIVRKMAHVCEYMLVGFFMMLCLRVYTKKFLRHIAWPLFGGLFVALVDETIQIFSFGRGSSVVDVWIDFFGVSLGVLVALFLLCLWRMCYILYKNRDME